MSATQVKNMMKSSRKTTRKKRVKKQKGGYVYSNKTKRRTFSSSLEPSSRRTLPTYLQEDRIKKKQKIYKPKTI